jgi:hypothetical protein
VLDATRDRGHGRSEVRTLKAATVHHFGFPTPLRSFMSSARPATCALPRGDGRP